LGPGKKWLLAGAALVVVAALAMPVHRRLREEREIVRRTLCVHNFKLLAIPLKQYADDHEGRFPDRFSLLYPKYVSTSTLELLICPEASVNYVNDRGIPHPFPSNPTPEEIDSVCSYAIVPGLSTNDDASTVIAFEKKDNHGGMGRSLLYLDGRGAWEPPENWRNGPPNRNLPKGW
jgi:hypothetical protein